MKRLVTTLVLLTVLTGTTVLFGCNKINDAEVDKETETASVESTALSTATEETAALLTSSKKTTALTSSLTATSSSSTSISTTLTSDTESEEETGSTEEKKTEEKKYFGLDEAAIISIAQDQYNTSVSIYQTYLYDCPYAVDYDDTAFTNEGEPMVRITDPRINSITDVIDDYESYFSERYEDPVPMHYIEQDGGVYFIQYDRATDYTYQRTEIESIISVEGDSIVFNARSYYSDGSTVDRQYSLVHNENGVEWKTGIFTSPN